MTQGTRQHMSSSPTGGMRLTGVHGHRLHHLARGGLAEAFLGVELHHLSHLALGEVGQLCGAERGARRRVAADEARSG